MVRPQPHSRIRWCSLRRLCAVALLALLCVACGSPGGGSTVILISLDGTRPQDVRLPGLPALAEIIERGALAERLTPVFPSNTFPNHVSLVTGVGPEVHGIVGNRFLDPERGVFDYAADPDWIEVEPLWSLLEASGLASASFHWVGSEGAWRSGRGPRYWVSFDGTTAESEKVEQILAWLEIDDPAERPRFVTAWFHGADHAGHRHGPDAAEVQQVLASQDRALARLVSALDARGAFAHTTLLLVSDHGMAEVHRRVDLEASLQESGIGARVFGGGGFVSVALDHAGDAPGAVARAASLGLEAHPRLASPAAWHTRHPRFSDLVVLAPVGVTIAGANSRRPAMRGAHGYRPDAPEMGALLLALGRGVPAGTRLAPARVLDVAPTVLALLGIPAPAWMEGRAIEALVPRDASEER